MDVVEEVAYQNPSSIPSTRQRLPQREGHDRGRTRAAGAQTAPPPGTSESKEPQPLCKRPSIQPRWRPGIGPATRTSNPRGRIGPHESALDGSIHGFRRGRTRNELHTPRAHSRDHRLRRGHPGLAPIHAGRADGGVAAAGQREQVTSVEGITEYRLANGLRVLLFPDPSKPTITVNVTYLVGSRHENYGETGMAHLLEHLVFKGTPKHPNIPQELTAHGARPNGIDLVRPHQLLRDLRRRPTRTWSWALDLEADRMVNSFIAKKDLDSEMTVVRNEFEMRRERPGRRPRASACCRPPTSGTTTASPRSARAPTSRTCRSSACRPSTASYYQPDNAVLLVAGKFDEAKTLALVNADLRRDPEADAHAADDLHRRADAGRRAQRHAAARRRRAGVAVGVPRARRARTRTSRRVDLLGQVLGDTPSGRLTRRWSRRRRPTSVGGDFMQLHDPGFADVRRAGARRTQSLDDARDDAARRRSTTSPTSPPTQGRGRARARRTLLKNIDLTLNNADRVGLELSRVDRHGRLAPVLPAPRPHRRR